MGVGFQIPIKNLVSILISTAVKTARVVSLSGLKTLSFPLTGCSYDKKVQLLAVLSIDWVKSLPPAELKLLNSADFHNSETTQTITNSEIPPEQISYENIAEKSHFYSLRDQLLFMFAPELRREYENYVSQQAANSGYRTLEVV